MQQYVKGLVNGLTLPLQMGTLTAYIAPPAVADDTAPLCYIWGAHGVEKRQTMPRAQPGNLGSGGFKRTPHEVQLWLYWAELADDPNADSAFPVVIDAVMGALRNVQIGAKLTDSATGAVSTVQQIGEDMEYGYEPVRALEDQRMQQYEALVTATVWELIQA